MDEPPPSDSWLSGGGAVPISDMAHIRAILIASARLRRSMSYSELLIALGHRFTRPKMRALCKTLDAIDDRARAAGEPELAVLVVRESDGLPGQGWWVGARSQQFGYTGPWLGPEASAFVFQRQTLAFDHWSRTDDP
jgi:hypothetical protein